jgi:hypothetical protein
MASCSLILVRCFRRSIVRAFTNYLILCVGVSVITIVNVIPRHGAKSSNILTADYYTETYYMDYYDGTVWPRSVHGTAEIGLDANYPAAVRATEGFVVVATVKLKRVNCMSPLPIFNFRTGNLIGSREVGRAEEASYNDTVQKFFATRPLEFRLQLAGANVSPTGPQRPQTDSVRWSVMPTTEKITRLNGSIEIDISSDSQEAKSYTFRTRSAPISIAVSESVFTVPNVLRWSATFFGSLLTLPGILSFIQTYRKKKRHTAKKENNTNDVRAQQTR